MLPLLKASKLALRVVSLSIYLSMTDLTRSLIFDGDCQMSCLTNPPGSRPISPHYAHLISHDSKGPFSGAAAYSNGGCLEVPEKLEKKISYSIDSSEEFLVVSPYSSRPHLLELKDLDEPSQLLAKALTVMRHVRDDYAITPCAHAFKWQEVMQK